MAIAAREGEAKGRAEPSLRFDIQAPGVPTRTIELKQDIVRIGKLSSSHLQIQDPAVSLVPRVAAVGVAIVLFGPSIASQLSAFASRLWPLVITAGTG